MYPIFNHAAVRFAAGFSLAVFVSLPVVWFVTGDVYISVVAAVIVAAIGAAAGMFWVRKPPEIFYRLPPNAHGPGLFGRPAVRFAAGFVVSTLVFLAVMVILPDRMSSILAAPTIAVGITGGLTAARRSATIFSSRSRSGSS